MKNADVYCEMEKIVKPFVATCNQYTNDNQRLENIMSAVFATCLKIQNVMRDWSTQELRKKGVEWHPLTQLYNAEAANRFVEESNRFNEENELPDHVSKEVYGLLAQLTLIIRGASDQLEALLEEVRDNRPAE